MFAVIDTETNWRDKVMSIGVVIADDDTLEEAGRKYYVLNPEYLAGGMYSGAMAIVPIEQTRVCSRETATQELVLWLRENGVTRIFAYNAAFDCSHMRELGEFEWFDIMRIAAYRQFNPRICADEECCGTGRLKRNYGVQSMVRRMTGRLGYFETHNALYDAVDELEGIMKPLGRNPKDYIPLK